MHTPGLLSPLLLLAAAGSGSSAHPSAANDALATLASRGIKSAQLTDASMRANYGESCYCPLACDTLAATFGADQVSLKGAEAYDTGMSGYWSGHQASTRPGCFFKPLNAQEVSAAILLARATQCPFAAKGSGHAPFKGASSSEGGITIDLANMNHVIPSADRKTVTLGPGSNWARVYSALEPANLTVTGGRVATVGVSGLLLGGGISYFSSSRGWACDNVLNYEIVVASGEVLNVNALTYPDLFWALRGGGGGNFGIVTQFEATAYEQGPMWGGNVFYEFYSSKDKIIDAIVNYAGKGPKRDRGAHLIASFAYAQIYNTWVTSVMMNHAAPQPEGKHPEVFDDFVFGEPMMSTLRTAPQSELTIEVDQMSPYGFRQTFWTSSFHVDRALISDVLDIFHEEVTPIKDLDGLMPALPFQVMTESSQELMKRSGGNALGVSEAKKLKPLIILNISMAWSKESDDRKILTACHNIIERTEALAHKRGLYHPFKYLNYASQWQDPVASYGAENKAKLMRVSKKYDPESVFQKLHTGYFKLEGAPSVWEW